MFCFQCQETSRNQGCTVMGVCGKNDEVSNLQDVLIFVVKGVALYSNKLRQNNKIYENVNEYLYRALFSTITNANFDGEEIKEYIYEGIKLRKFLAKELENTKILIDSKFEGSRLATFEFDESCDLVDLAHEIGVLRTENEDIRSLREIILYGLKGLSAYGFHALNLKFESNKIFDFFEKALIATEDNDLSAEKLTNLVLM